MSGSDVVSQAEDSSDVNSRPNKPRLQRSKAQSRKTFRLRKSRIEAGHKSDPAVNLENGQSSTKVLGKAPLKPEQSYEEDSALSQTSSTSGYRENCSLLMMALENHQQFPSTSTVVPVASGSPDSSTDLGHSQHSLLMVFDEDTLI